jgi:hypothetical protein
MRKMMHQMSKSPGFGMAGPGGPGAARPSMAKRRR